MYCERCNRLVDREKCPGCGRRDLRMPRYDDFCFLAEPDALWVQAQYPAQIDYSAIALATVDMASAG